MSNGAALAKISRPKLRSSHARRRVFKLLDEARKRPIVWIVGPPGSGKTTLVNSYLDQQRLPCLWYQCDAGDADSATFFHYFGQATRRVARGRKPSLPALTPESALGLTTFSKHFFRDVCGRLESPFVVVLDNYQEVPTRGEFHELIASGLEEVPDGGTFLIISRDEPPPAMARLEVNQLIARVGWDALQFTRDETEAVVKLRTGSLPADTDITHLQDTTRGWVAGVLLLLEREKSLLSDAGPYENSVPQLMFDYFANEVFEKTSPETQNLLMRTAWLPGVSARIAERLCDQNDVGIVLNDLCTRHFFTDRIENTEPVYRYHPLFAGFLRVCARHHLSDREMIELLCKAAELLETDGQIEQAVTLFIEANAWAQIIRLITVHAPRLLSEGRSRTLEAWLNAVPESHGDSDSWCLFWRGATQMPVAPQQARRCLEQAFGGFLEARDVAGLYMSWASIVETYFSSFIEAMPLDRWLTLLEDLRRDYPEYPSAEIEARVTAAAFFAFLSRQPHHPDLGVWRSRVEGLVLASEDPNQRILLGVQLLHHCSWVGGAARARVLFDTLSNCVDAPNVAPMVRISWWLAAAVYHWLFSGRPKKCHDAIERGVELSRRLGVCTFDKLLFGTYVQVSLSFGECKVAERYLAELAGGSDDGAITRTVLYHSLASWHALQCGDVTRAIEYGSESLGLSHDAGMPFQEAVDHIRLAHALIQNTQFDEAECHLDDAGCIGQAMQSHPIGHECLLAKARIKFERGHDRDGIQILKAALEAGKRSGYRSSPWGLPMIDAAIYAKALEHGIEIDFVRDIIRARRLFPRDPPYFLDDWPWPIKIKTLGRFEIIRDGQTLSLPVQAQRKRLAMLKALVAYGGRAVSENQLSHALWPDADGDAAHQNFATTLHRLRKLLNCREAIVLRDRHLSLEISSCWVDVWAFEHCAGRLDTNGRAMSDAELGMAESALSLYRGPFLGEQDYPWAVVPRARLRRKFVRLVARVAEHFKNERQLERSIACYQRGLDIDPLIEEFYCALMSSYADLDRRSEALATYERCEQTLRATLGVIPSTKTRSLHRRL